MDFQASSSEVGVFARLCHVYAKFEVKLERYCVVMGKVERGRVQGTSLRLPLKDLRQHVHVIPIQFKAMSSTLPDPQTH